MPSSPMNALKSSLISCGRKLCTRFHKSAHTELSSITRSSISLEVNFFDVRFRTQSRVGGRCEPAVYPIWVSLPGSSRWKKGHIRFLHKVRLIKTIPEYSAEAQPNGISFHSPNPKLRSQRRS